MPENKFLEAWDKLQEIFEDGKLKIEEVPNLLIAIGLLIKELRDLMVELGADDNAIAVFDDVSEALNNIINQLVDNKGDLAEALKNIDKILEDEKVKADEIIKLVVSISKVLNVVLSIVLPFINPAQAMKFLTLLKIIR